MKVKSILATSVTACMLLVVMGLSPVRGEVEIPNVELINAAFESQDSLIQGLLVESQGYISVTSFDVNLAGFTGATYYVKYAKQGNKEYREIKNSKNGELFFYEEVSFDGTQTKVLHHNPSGKSRLMGALREGRPASFSKVFVPNTTRVLVWDKELLGRLREGEVELLPEPEAVDGTMSYVLVGRCREAPEVLKYKVWVDPKIGFMPRRVDQIGPINTVSRRFMSYEEVEQGIWFPMRVESETWKGDKVTNRNIYSILSVTVNNDIPADIFKINFPPGTVVQDEVAGITYNLPDGQ